MHSLNRPSTNLPKSDGTTSTNYGPSFEVSSTAIFVLRCLKGNKGFEAWINYTPYEPWDDIVAKVDGKVLCAQLKHNEKLDKEKLTVCLDKRESVCSAHPKESIVFVYFATTPDDGVRDKYSKVENCSDLLRLLTTNSRSVYFDNNGKYGDTFFCMTQNDVASESVDVKQALSEYIGQNYLSQDYLKDVQTKFVDYIRLRYFRLLKQDEPLTDQEIRTELSYTILSRFKIEYLPSNAVVEVANNIKTILEKSSVVVVNHRWSSPFQEEIWRHLMSYWGSVISKKHLKAAELDELWIKGKIHMPLLSPSKETDKVILRALEIGSFKPKVLILRPRVFGIKEGQNIITLLQNLTLSSEIVETKTKNEPENFKFAEINLSQIIQNKNLKLHQDTFCKIAKDYFKGAKDILQSFVEAHDEYHYVNDFNTFGSELLPAIFAAIRIKNIDLNIIRHLVKLEADVNGIAAGGLRPVFFAIQEDRADVLELLLQSGASPDPADAAGVRPLFVATLENKVKMVDLLIRHGSDRNSADFYGVRPLFMAYSRNNFDVMRLLLKDFDKAAAANTQGNHILHQAAEDGSVECLKCILECCPNIKIFMTGDVMGKTPLDIAQGKESAPHKEFADILQKALKNV